VNLAPTRVIFGAACDEWLHYIEHDRKRRPSTVRDYRNTVGAMLRPAFGDSTPLDDITTAAVEAYRQRLVREGRLSGRTINKSLVLLHGIFKLAVKRHGLRSNPAEAAERQPQRRSGHFQVLDPGEVALLASKAENAQDAALYTVAAFTGLRLGELLALRWDDVDFAKRLVHVRRSWVLGQEDTPKSHKVRSVPLIDQAARALDTLSRREHFTGPDDRVFVNDVGEVLGQDLLRRRFKRALTAAGLPPLRLHDLRHSFGTLAVQVFPLSDVKA
jgi:integrase